MSSNKVDSNQSNEDVTNTIGSVQSDSDSDSDSDDESYVNKTEHFTMLSDQKYMNSIVVFGLFIVLFGFVYIYGFHGILKFEKNLNYLLALLFSLFGIISSLVLIMSTFKYLSEGTMTEDEKQSSRNGMLVMIILIIFFSMMAIIRFNYSKLFNALNKAL